MHERTTDAAETAVPLPDQQGRSYTPGASEQGRAMTNVEAGRLGGCPAASREPFGRAERLHLRVLAGTFALVAAMFGAGAIALNNLSGQILGLRAEMREEIGQLSDRTDQLSDRMDQFSDRLTRVETLIETHLVPASNVRDPAGP